MVNALEMPPQDREPFLRAQCDGDQQLLQLALRILKQGEKSDSPLSVKLDTALTENDPLVPPVRLNPDRIGPYRLLDKLGEGGFGIVYAAEQSHPVKRRVALKVLKPGMDSKAVLARFETERQVLALLDHPGIARVLDAGETERGLPYFVMDLVKGEPIHTYCDRHRLSTEDRLRIFSAVCRTVHHAHQQGIIHRDLKPSNIMVTLIDNEPTPKVIDFGIAKAAAGTLSDLSLYTEQGVMIGTPSYMSPEQAEMTGLAIDERSDIYSLGVVLYQLLSGTLPIDPDTLREKGYGELLRVLREVTPPRPSDRVQGENSSETARRRNTNPAILRHQLKSELDWIVLKALEKDRALRYESAAAFAADLDRFLRQEPVLAGPPSRLYRLRKFAGRHRAIVSLGTLLVATLVFGAIDRLVIDPIRDEQATQAAINQAVDDALQDSLLTRFAGRSILVVPFKNIGKSSQQEYFADGIAEELLNLLTRIEALRVIPRTTSWTFKHKEINVADVRERLNVSHILDGSVRKAGNRVRVTAQLTDTNSNRTLWSQSYDRILDDIFAIQDEIANEVVGQLRLKLLDGTPTAEPVPPAAYDLYLRGRHLTSTVRDEDAFRVAVDLLTQAVELAPAFVPALWELARAVDNTRHYNVGDPGAIRARVDGIVDRMAELAPDSSYANGWLATLAERDGELQASALYREKAIAGAQDTQLFLQLSLATRLLIILDRHEEANTLARYLVERNPACEACVNMLAWTYRAGGQHRQAAAELEKLRQWREITPGNFWQLGVSWLVAGEPAKSLDYFEHAPPGNRKLGQILAMHDMGHQRAFDREFAQLLSEADLELESIARIAAWTGQNDLAFEYLDRAVEQRGPGMVTAIKLGSDLYAPIKSDPRWRQFLDRYDANDEDLSQIRFNPKLPEEVKAALAAK